MAHFYNRTFLAFSFLIFTSLNAQIEKPKPATTSSKPTTTTAQATVEVTWLGTGTAIIHIGEKTISLTNKEMGKLSVAPGIAMTIKVEKPDKTYSYSDFLKFNEGKNYLSMNLINGTVYAQSENEETYKERIEAEGFARQHLARIGQQIWMTENLNVDHFRNGDIIPLAITDEEWIKAGKEGKPARCYYANDPANAKIYGMIYNWYAVNDPRGLAPDGFHVPSDSEWTLLTDYLGGGKIAETKLKNSTGWNQTGNGSNESGFTALPSGYRSGNGKYYGLGYYSYYYTSTQVNATNAWNRNLSGPNGKGYRDAGGGGKQDGLSVRCIKH